MFRYSVPVLGSTADTFYCQSTSVFLVLFPCTTQCLFLSGTCYASVLGWLLEEIYDFLLEGVHSAPEVDSRAALLWPGAVLGYVLDMPVVVHVKVVALPRRCAEAVSMVQTVRLTMDFCSCSTRWPLSLLSWSCRFTSSSWRRGRFSWSGLSGRP